MNDEGMKAIVEQEGLDWDRIKRGIERMLPVIETISRLTPNPFDDAVVMFLKVILQKDVDK